jgi:hypothetical protein
MLSSHAAKWLQCCASPIDHTQDTTTVQDDLTGRCHAADHVRRDRVTRQDAPMPLKISLATSGRYRLTV